MQQERVSLDQVGDYITERVVPLMSSRATSLSSRATSLSSRANREDRGIPFWHPSQAQDDSAMRISDFEAMVRRFADEVPADFLEGVAEIAVARHRASSRARRDLHPRRVHPAPVHRLRRRRNSEPGGALPRLLRRARGAPGRFRLAGRGVGDADPRAAASPGMARSGPRARGLRPGGGAELRPAGRRAVRSALLSRRRARRRGRVPGEDDVFLERLVTVLPPRSGSSGAADCTR